MSGAATEKPTPKRLRDARLRGEVAVSPELTSAVALAAGALALAMCGRDATAALALHLRSALLHACAGEPAPEAALAAAMLQLGRVALPPLLAAAFAATAAALVQVGPLWSLSAVRPRADRLNPAAGIRRLLSGTHLATVALGVAKVLAVAFASWHLAGDLASSAALAGASTPAAALTAVASPARSVVMTLGGLLLAFGVLDLLVVRRRHLRGLRMTLDEVRREQKEQDGDPQHKSDRRRAHRALASAMPVARATCVVVNPTHFAIALHHDPAGEDAPTIVAKGCGDEAHRIRSQARLASVPIVRDVPLARALYRLADVGDQIPEELYDAAAAVLVHVHGLSTERTP